MSAKQQQEKYINKSHILVVDDDKRICDLVSRYLIDHDFLVLTANSAHEALGVLERFEVDAVVLDIMMPGMTGIEMTKNLRAQAQDVPVLLLTALGEVDDRIAGFESGADDYLTKPFEPQELVLRLKSILKRTQNTVQTKKGFQIGNWHFDPKHDELAQGDNILSLTAAEANLLRALCESVNEVISREQLAECCAVSASERTIDVQVTRLRRKLEENSKTPRHLQTVRGKGYILRGSEV